MKPVYEVRAVTVQPVTVAPFTILFQGNKGRVSMAVSCSDNNARTFTLSTSSSPFGNGQFLVLSSPFNVVLAYRDYGPLIRETIYILAGFAGINVVGTEVVLVPQG